MHINIYVRTYVGDPWLGTLLIPLKCNMEQSRAQGASLTMQSRSGEPITSFRGGHFFLSNMYPCPCGVEFDGEIYDYSENAFQAAKTNPWRSQAALTPCVLGTPWQSRSVMERALDAGVRAHPLRIQHNCGRRQEDSRFTCRACSSFARIAQTRTDSSFGFPESPYTEYL